MKEQRKKVISSAGLYAGTLLKWVALAGLIGLTSGLLGTVFHVGVEIATELRGANAWLVRYSSSSIMQGAAEIIAYGSAVKIVSE